VSTLSLLALPVVFNIAPGEPVPAQNEVSR